MKKHKDDLLGGEWLNDSHIHAVQQLIQLDPDLQHIRGLQNPIFGRSLQFDADSPFWGKSLDYSEHHWVYIPLNSAGVWQSEHSQRLIQRKQIAAIVHSPEEEIKLEYANVQVNNIYVN